MQKYKNKLIRQVFIKLQQGKKWLNTLSEKFFANFNQIELNNKFNFGQIYYQLK
jgi:hypothetical protein